MSLNLLGLSAIGILIMAPFIGLSNPSIPFSILDLNGSFLDLNDTPSSYSGQAGKVPVVNSDENGLTFSDVNGVSGDSNQVKVSGNDTTPGYLEDKAINGFGIQTRVNNEGANETLSFDLNASPADLNASQSCPSGQALQEIGNATSCISVGGGGGSGGSVLAGDVNGGIFGENQGDFNYVFPNALDVNQSVNTKAIDFNSLPTGESEVYKQGRLYYDNDKGALEFFNFEPEVELQIGQEGWIQVRNETGSDIENGSVVQVVGTSGDKLLVQKAQANVAENAQNVLGIATHTIETDTNGFVTFYGKINDLNTLGLVEGEDVWLSADTNGGFTTTKPPYPNFPIRVGNLVVSSETTGIIEVFARGDILDIQEEAWNGSFVETFQFDVNSNGTIITGALQRKGGGNLTVDFNGSYTTLDTTPPIPISLTPGSATNPQINYVYIPEVTKTLTVSTSDWPIGTQHIKVAQVSVLDSNHTQLFGALSNQNWNDHLADNTSEQGHILDIAERLRISGAVWWSGTEGTSTIENTAGLDNVYVQNTSGNVYQLHRQNFPSHDSNVDAGNDVLFVVNDPTTPYETQYNLANETLDSTGASLSNKSFSFVLWGSQSSGDSNSQLFINLPNCSYNSAGDASNDVDNCSVYTIPTPFRSTGFLIARFNYSLNAASGGTWTLDSTQDLRGFVPNNTAGSGAGASGITTFLGLTDTPSSYTGNGLDLLRVNSGESAVEFVDANAFLQDSNAVIKNPVETQTIQFFPLHVDENVLTEDCLVISTAHAFCRQSAATTRIKGGGNIQFLDAPFFGTNNFPAGKMHTDEGIRLTTTGGALARINPNSYFGALDSVPTSGIYFNTDVFNSIELRISGEPKFRTLFDQTGGGLGWLLPVDGTPGTSQMPYASFYMRDFGNLHDGNQFGISREGVDGNWQHINAKMTLGTPLDLTIDANWTGDKNELGNTFFDGNNNISRKINFYENAFTDLNYSLGLDEENYFSVRSNTNGGRVRLTGQQGGTSNDGIEVRGNGNVFFPNLSSSAAAVQPVGLLTNELVINVSGTKYKKNIESIESVLDTKKIYDIVPSCWLDKQTSGLGCGVIAENVEQYYPEFVFYDENGLPDSVYYAGLYTVAIAELQNKNKQIFDLNAQVQDLEVFKLEVCMAIPGLPSCA